MICLFSEKEASRISIQPPLSFIFFLLGLPFGELIRKRGIAAGGLFLLLPLQIFSNVALVCARRFFALFKIAEPFPVTADAGEHFLLPFAAKLQLFVAIGATGVRLNREAPTVAAFPIRANQHPAPFAVNVEQEFAAIRAFFAGDVIVDVGRVACDHLPNEAGCVFSHFYEEGGQTFLPFADALKPLLPLGSERRALQIGRDEPDELPPLGGGADFLALPLDAKGVEQLLDDVRPRGRRAEAACLLQRTAQLLVLHLTARVLHGR